MESSPPDRPGDTIEQSVCRERTEEEQRAIDTHLTVKMLIAVGAVTRRPRTRGGSSAG